MLFLEQSARLWLIVHGVLAIVLAAVATHLAVWLRGLWSGRAVRWRGARWLAAISFALYVVVFVLGNLIYPLYKARVRLEYFEDQTTIKAESVARAEASARRDAKAPSSFSASVKLAAAARWFDVKEHVVALGLPVAGVVWLILWRARRPSDGDNHRASERLALVGACFAAACAWLGVLVGLYVTSLRAVGGGL